MIYTHSLHIKVIKTMSMKHVFKKLKKRTLDNAVWIRARVSEH